MCGSCGAKLDVPRLRDLRNLPVENAAKARGGAGWSFRLGVLSAGFLLAAVLAAGAGWLHANRPAPPPKFNEVVRERNVVAGLEQKTPTELFELYHQFYAPMAKLGATKVEPPRIVAQTEAVRVNGIYRDWLLYAAAGVAGLSVLSYPLLPK